MHKFENLKKTNNLVKNLDPLVSMVMPVYNGEKFVVETINSILNQSYSNFEFIIVDDGSTDSTYALISSISDSRIKIIRNEENKGIAYSFNVGIANSKGKYIAHIGADDLAHKDRFKYQVDFLENNPMVGICGTQATFFGIKKGVSNMPLTHDEIASSIIFRSPMIHATIMGRSEIFRENQYFSTPTGEDWNLWYRLIPKTKFANLKQNLGSIRYHYESTTQKNLSTGLIVEREWRKKMLSDLGIKLKNNHETIFIECFSKCNFHRYYIFPFFSLTFIAIILIQGNFMKKIYPKRGFAITMMKRLGRCLIEWVRYIGGFFKKGLSHVDSV